MRETEHGIPVPIAGAADGCALPAPAADRPTHSAEGPERSRAKSRAPFSNGWQWPATLVLVNAAAVLSLRNVPTLDGPMLLYYIEAFRSLLGGHPAFHSYYQLNYTTGAHVFYFYFVTALSWVAGLLTAEKLFVVVYIAWLAWAFHYFAESMAPGRGFPALLLMFPFAVNIAIYWAFYDFSMGLATALFACGWWLRRFDRLTPSRSAVWLGLISLLVTMHLMQTAVVVLFTGVHTAAYSAMQYLRARGGFARRAARAARASFKPAAHVCAGAILWLIFKPAGSLSQEGFPYFERPLERLYEIAVFRAVSPFESRFYRACLGAALAAAAVMTVAALWRRRRALSPRAEWAAALTALALFAAYFIVPFWMSDGAFVPQRFALIGAFFLLASSALCALSPRQQAVLAAGAVVLSLSTTVYQRQIDLSLEGRYAATLDLPPLANARLAAIVSEQDITDPRLTFAQFWAGVPYVRRSGMALLNSPWLDQRDKWLKVSHREACQFLNPNLMRSCLLRVDGSPERPAIDALIGVRGAPPEGPGPTTTEIIARRYGLTVRIWDSPYLSIYARPGANAASAAMMAENR